MNKINYAGKYIFLGGACTNTTWREEFKTLVSDRIFDPCKPDTEWDDNALNEERRIRRMDCTHWVYVISSKNPGILGIAQMVEDLILHTATTFVCFLEEEGTPWPDEMKQSIKGLEELARQYTKYVYTDIRELASAVEKAH